MFKVYALFNYSFHVFRLEALEILEEGGMVSNKIKGNYICTNLCKTEF